VVHSTEGYIGGVDDLIQWAARTHGYADPRREVAFPAVEKFLKDVCKQQFARHIQRSALPFCHFDFHFADDDTTEQVIFELFTQQCAKTCENFMALCSGGGVTDDGTALHYKGSALHRIVKDGWIQGGDIAAGSKGTGGASVFGETFPDESFVVKHDQKGILSMAAGRDAHSNASQFFVTQKVGVVSFAIQITSSAFVPVITFSFLSIVPCLACAFKHSLFSSFYSFFLSNIFPCQPLPYLDGKRVAFGRVVTGFSTLDRVNNAATANQRPCGAITVAACGAYAPPVQAIQVGSNHACFC
jgi:cyclophilin family peptidyl-prolyl cis-trans isomerase